MILWQACEVELFILLVPQSFFVCLFVCSFVCLFVFFGSNFFRFFLFLYYYLSVFSVLLIIFLKIVFIKWTVNGFTYLVHIFFGFTVRFVSVSFLCVISSLVISKSIYHSPFESCHEILESHPNFCLIFWCTYSYKGLFFQKLILKFFKSFYSMSYNWLQS